MQLWKRNASRTQEKLFAFLDLNLVSKLDRVGVWHTRSCDALQRVAESSTREVRI